MFFDFEVSWVSYVIKRVFTRDFISGKVKYFHFGVWSISYNCLQDTNRNETHCGCYFIVVFWQKWNFILGDKILCKHYPKWNHMKGNICTCVSKNDWLLLNGTFISGYPDKISFRPQWKVMQAEFLLWWFEILLPVDFISGLM